MIRLAKFGFVCLRAMVWAVAVPWVLVFTRPCGFCGSLGRVRNVRRTGRVQGWKRCPVCGGACRVYRWQERGAAVGR
jgi:hypothetical protein